MSARACATPSASEQEEDSLVTWLLGRVLGSDMSFMLCKFHLHMHFVRRAPSAAPGHATEVMITLSSSIDSLL